MSRGVVRQGRNTTPDQDLSGKSTWVTGLIVGCRRKWPRGGTGGFDPIRKRENKNGSEGTVGRVETRYPDRRESGGGADRYVYVYWRGCTEGGGGGVGGGGFGGGGGGLGDDPVRKSGSDNQR